MTTLPEPQNSGAKAQNHHGIDCPFRSPFVRLGLLGLQTGCSCWHKHHEQVVQTVTELKSAMQQQVDQIHSELREVQTQVARAVQLLELIQKSLLAPALVNASPPQTPVSAHLANPSTNAVVVGPAQITRRESSFFDLREPSLSQDTRTEYDDLSEFCLEDSYPFNK